MTRSSTGKLAKKADAKEEADNPNQEKGGLYRSSSLLLCFTIQCPSLSKLKYDKLLIRKRDFRVVLLYNFK